MWHFTVCFTIHSQKAVCSLFINQLCVQCHWLWQHHQLKLIHGLLWCCIQWCHSSVDNSPSPWWHHQIDTFSALLAICAGNSQSLVISLHKGQWCGALMFSLIYVWINGWVNNGEAGDLRCHRAHYSVLPKVFWAPVLRTSGSWNLPVRMEGSLVRNFNMHCWYMFLTLGLFGRRVIVVTCACPSVCLSVPIILVNTITQSVYPISPPNLLGGFNMALPWMVL